MIGIQSSRLVRDVSRRGGGRPLRQADLLRADRRTARWTDDTRAGVVVAAPLLATPGVAAGRVR